MLLSYPAKSEHLSEHMLSVEEWVVIEKNLSLLDNTAYMPSLLPFVMSNRDALELSDKQLATFYQWRKTHYANMVDIMNQIIEKKVAFKIESLSGHISNDHLLTFQEEIQQLQRQLLKIRLSCRKTILDTLSTEQWENFAFIASEDDTLSPLFSQTDGITKQHRH